MDYRFGLSASSLFIPALAYLLATGAYVGNTIAFVFILPLFLVVQSVCNMRFGQRIGAVLFDLAAVTTLFTIGLGMASGFLLPLGSLSAELTRSTDYLSQHRWYFQFRDVYELVLSSTYLRAKDHSMYAMQLPLTLIPMAVFIDRSTLARLAPFLAVGGAAIVMSFEGLSAVPTLLIRLAPFVGYSRFPVGDYRTLLALPILLVLCGGLNRLLAVPIRGWVLAGRYAAGVVILTALAVPASLLAWTAGQGHLATIVALLQLAPAVVLCAFLPLTRRSYAWRALPASVALASVASAAPVLADMVGFWQVSERSIEERAGFRPWSDRGWRLNEVLDEHLSSRPPRSRAGDEVAIAWRGYLGGEFMADDYGGAVLRARRAVEQDPELRSFVEGPTRLVAHTCMASTCQSADVGRVSIAEAGPGAVNFNWQPIEYGRSKLRYHLSLPSSGVVVESELFSEGWRARIGDGEVQANRNQRRPTRVAFACWRL